MSAGEEHPVATVEELIEIIPVCGQGQHQRQPARVGDAVHVPGQHPEALPFVVHQGDQSYDRFHRASHPFIVCHSRIIALRIALVNQNGFSL